MLKDFDLMKNNAVRFNGPDHPLAAEANAIYEFTKSEIADNRQQLTMMEEAVRDQMSSKKSKKAKAAQDKMARSSDGGFDAVVNLGMDAFDFTVSDSDDSD
jgi:hypothetical protein